MSTHDDEAMWSEGMGAKVIRCVRCGSDLVPVSEDSTYDKYDDRATADLCVEPCRTCMDAVFGVEKLESERIAWGHGFAAGFRTGLTEARNADYD